VISGSFLRSRYFWSFSHCQYHEGHETLHARTVVSGTNAQHQHQRQVHNSIDLLCRFIRADRVWGAGGDYLTGDTTTTPLDICWERSGRRETKTFSWLVGFALQLIIDTSVVEQSTVHQRLSLLSIYYKLNGRHWAQNSSCRKQSTFG
jgi:hypothetical protein